MKQAGYDICYLAACVINGQPPDRQKIAAMEPEKLYRMSRAHSLWAITATALDAAGISFPPAWRAEKEKAVRKSILFDSEREKILAFMEQCGIRYLPMKGVILKQLYPTVGLREMADNDILYDSRYRDELVAFMRQSGYTVASVGKGAHDTYYKAPIYNFELHTTVFAQSTSETFYAYYQNVWERLLPMAGTEYGHCMSDDDYYVYMTAHEYKHYSHSGTGLRSLLDRYVYLSRKGDALHFDYIEKECRALGIAAFERDSRALCQKVFSAAPCALSSRETALLEYYMLSSTYGTRTQGIRHQIERDYGSVGRFARCRYLWRRLFPQVAFFREYCPIAYKYKILIPGVWLYRLLRGLLRRPGQIRRELSIVSRIDPDEKDRKSK